MSDDQKLCTTSGRPVDVVRAEQTAYTGQHKDYIVLCEEERAKGFVRPYRDAYCHVGVRPKHGTRPLNSAELEMWPDEPRPFAVFEEYPAGGGRYWTKDELASGCGSVTTMGRALSETYARNPKFYGATFCVNCNRHLPVGEFMWTRDNERVGS